MKSLAQWDQEFAGTLQEKCPKSERSRAGVFLSVVPDKQVWNEFLAGAQTQNRIWANHPGVFPNALVLLYAGLAFYEYDDNAFWPAFGRCLHLPPLPGNQQHVWNSAFETAMLRGGFRFFDYNYVGSAIYLVGIPLSMWEGFLSICEWALWKSDWKSLTDQTWREAMERRLGGQRRLIRFLTENRETSSSFIREMLDARRILTSDMSAKISAISQASILRREYFEEVPETADFLRPQDPDSLLDDKPRLVWRERRIAIHIPPAPYSSVEWECFGNRISVSSVASELPLNGKAFAHNLAVNFCNGDASCTIELPSLQPYGLFDEQRQRFANLRRTRLPTAAYRLISKEEIQVQARERDWVIEPNENFELEDGVSCYVTHLWPLSDRPQLVINGGPPLHFGRRERVNLRIYSGSENNHVLRFGWRDENLICEQLPHLVLEIPTGFLPDDDDVSDEEMRQEFAVLLDDQRATGRWVWFQNYPENSPEWDYYEWRWENAQAPQQSYELKVLSQKAGFLPFGLRPSQHVTIASATGDELWPSPSRLGKFWIWVFLAQIQDDPTWEEFWIARQAIAGYQNLRINQNDWKKLEHFGYVRLRRQFSIQKSALQYPPGIGSESTARFAGLPNRLYSLIQKVKPLKPIKVVEERGLPPYLEIVWPANQRQFLRSICPQAGITLVDNLWSH